MLAKLISRASLFVVAGLLLAAPASAQLLWNAHELLSRTSSPRVTLTAKKGSETVPLDTIDRAWVERAVAVTSRMVSAYGMSAPAIFITYDKQPNAFVTFDRERRPIMAVNTEMLRMVGDDDHELAAVIGHELGHLKANHLTDGVARQGLITFLGVLAGLAIDINQAKRGVDTAGLGTRIGTLGGGLVNAKFSRDQEREADDLGIRAMTQAGFQPHAAARVWNRMQARGGGGQGLWLDSHPSHVERERSLQVAAVNLVPAPVLAGAPAAAAVTASPTITPAASEPPSGRAAVAIMASAASSPPLSSTTEVPRVHDPWPQSRMTTFALSAEEEAADLPGPYHRGLAAQRAGLLDAAVASWMEAVQADDDERALALLGDAHLFGRGVVKDEVKALEYYQRSAAKGFGPSIVALADLTQRGVGRSADPHEAFRLFSIAHFRDSSRATARLSLMYANGTGVAKNAVLARRLAQQAAVQQDALGKIILGAMLRDGTGGASDPVRGFVLLQEAVVAAPHLGMGHYQLGLAYERGLGIAMDKTLAVESYRRALTNGVTGATDRLKALNASQ